MSFQCGFHDGNCAFGDGDKIWHRRPGFVIVFASQMTFDFSAFFIKASFTLILRNISPYLGNFLKHFWFW